MFKRIAALAIATILAICGPVWANLQGTYQWLGEAGSSDPFFGFTILILNMTGANGSTVFTDTSFKHRGNATVVSGAQVSTVTAPPNGTGALLLNGLGDSLTYPNSADFSLSAANSDQYTIEAFVNITAFGTGQNQVIFGFSDTIGSFSWNMYFPSMGGEFTFFFSPDGSSVTNITSSGAGITTGIWYYLAVDKDATGKIRLYRNTAMVGSATPANSVMFSPALINFGIGAASGNNSFLDGRLVVRITKGIARCASDAGCPVPLVPFPTD